jgi:glucosamine--fructose-6-phosphate aminotransferase (isomerizing)
VTETPKDARVTSNPASETIAARTHMFQEAAESAEVVARQIALDRGRLVALGQQLRTLAPRAVVTCGRGSSDHAATYAKYLIETRTGVLVASAAPSVSSVYAVQPQLQGALFLAVSQSGKSPDLLAAAEAAKASGALVVALVNVEDSPLAALADAVVPLRAGPETSVAATKSCLAAFAAILHLVAAWTDDANLFAALDALPARLAQAWPLDWRAAVEGLRGARDLYVIGRGVGFAAAQEAALKFKETCGLHAEAFSAAEVRHGPMAIVGPGFPVVMFAQPDETLEGVRELAAEFAARGAQVLLAGADATGATPLPTLADADSLTQPILTLLSFYRMTATLSVARGYDPDRPPHLNKVTETV